MPTYNRREFIPNAIRYFLKQDYEKKELIILDDGTDCIEDLVPTQENIRYYRLDTKITLGKKLNIACEYAKGNIIAHWDDDDWYAPQRLQYQVNEMQQPNIELCGINQLFYYDLNKKVAYQYRYPSNLKIWLSGSSLCYTKSLWNKNNFADINVGMDGLFAWATPQEEIKVLEDSTFSVLSIHSKNVSPKKTNNDWWQTFPVEQIQQIVGKDWETYANSNNNIPLQKTNGVQRERKQKIKITTSKNELKNIFVCLVHEKPDCILDLVRNLHFHDPSSTILLYNGGNNPKLLSNTAAYEKFQVVIHPNPQPQEHGYLHGFALDCMSFASDNFDFDTFTIVDSDQLCIRSGYTEYLSDFFSKSSKIGMLSSNPQRVRANNRSNHVALQAFKEYQLWKPLLDSFPNGADKFVHWTFWPSTVFTKAAIHDLLQLFKENKLLQNIMQQTKIWATEEVIFPTLVRLLDYEVAANPCSYDFVKYKINYSQSQIQYAFKNANAYWLHPVARNFNNPIRKYVRNQFHNYTPKAFITHQNDTSFSKPFHLLEVLEKSQQLQGWLSEQEANLLLNITLKACIESPSPYPIVEVGSYHGKATIILGLVVKHFFPKVKVVAIDPHDGRLGALDQKIEQVPPSFEFFQDNIESADLTEVVEAVKNKAKNVKWNQLISFLLIDGLHDYASVAKDFGHFSEWVRLGGYVGFHDYVDYFPGVKMFVDELLLNGKYQKVHLIGTLIILQKN